LLRTPAALKISSVCVHLALERSDVSYYVNITATDSSMLSKFSTKPRLVIALLF